MERLKFNFVTRAGTPPTTAAERKILEEQADALREEDDTIAYAHPNWIMDLQRDPIRKPVLLKQKLEEVQFQAATVPSGPNDPIFVWDYLPPPRGMNAIGAWNLAKGNKDVVVAVLDTGILPDHPDVKGSGNVQPGYDFVSPLREPRPRRIAKE